MSEPYEIIAAPFTVYTAILGTAFPVIDAAPAAAWVKLGASGDRNYEESGVTIEHPQEISTWRALGGSGPRKAFRTGEDFFVSLTLVDITLEHYKQSLNRNAVTDVAAVGGVSAGFRRIDLYRGLTVSTFALLVRGDFSPYGDNFKSQFQIPVAMEIGAPSVVFVKGAPAGLALRFQALEDTNAATVGERFGRLIEQDAAQ